MLYGNNIIHHDDEQSIDKSRQIRQTTDKFAFQALGVNIFVSYIVLNKEQHRSLFVHFSTSGTSTLYIYCYTCNFNVSLSCTTVGKLHWQHQTPANSQTLSTPHQEDCCQDNIILQSTHTKRQYQYQNLIVTTNLIIII